MDFLKVYKVKNIKGQKQILCFYEVSYSKLKSFYQFGCILTSSNISYLVKIK